MSRELPSDLASWTFALLQCYTSKELFSGVRALWGEDGYNQVTQGGAVRDKYTMGIQMEKIARNGGLFPIEINEQRSMRRRSTTPKTFPPVPKQTTKKIRAISSAKSAAIVTQKKVSIKSKRAKSTAADGVCSPPAAKSSSNPEEPTRLTITIPVKRKRVEEEPSQASQDPLLTEQRPAKRLKRAAQLSQPTSRVRISRRLQHLAPEYQFAETLESTNTPKVECNRSYDESPGRIDDCVQCRTQLEPTKTPGEYNEGVYHIPDDISLEPWHFEAWPLPPAPLVFRSLGQCAA